MGTVREHEEDAASTTTRDAGERGGRRSSDAPKIGLGKPKMAGLAPVDACRLSEGLFRSGGEIGSVEHESHVRRRQKCSNEVGMVPHVEDSCDPLWNRMLEDVRS